MLEEWLISTQASRSADVLCKLVWERCTVTTPIGASVCSTHAQQAETVQQLETVHQLPSYIILKFVLLWCYLSTGGVEPKSTCAYL